MEGEIALEAQEEMLPVGVDRSHCATGEALRPAVECVARLRSLDRADRAAHERGPDAPGRMADGVSLGHRR